MSSFDPSKAPLISETLLKKRRSLDELAYKRSVTVGKQTKRKKAVRGEDVKIKRPEQFMRESRIKAGSQQKMLRKQRKAAARTNLGVPVKASVGFAVRIHEGRHSSEDIKSELRKLGLNKKYDGCFVRLDQAGITKLRALDSYVAYGYISQKAVEELVHRRAFTVAGGSKRPLSDNLTVENLLGSKGILCLSDLSHEIFNVGAHFADALEVLCPFKLANPLGTYEKRVLKVHDAVEQQGGFLGEAMDALLEKIL
jgi:large subunit ribosomal protein L7e